MKVPSRVNRNGEHVCSFQIDDEFAEQVLAHKWSDSQRKRGLHYLRSRIDGRCVNLHQFVWMLAGRQLPSHPDSLDHINRDAADNRLENLRVASSRVQKLNRGVLSSKKSALPRGVTRVKHLRSSRVNGKYRACVRLVLGYYDTPEEASAEYEKFVENRIEEETKKEKTDDRAA